jgi:glucose/arabinose dehydrogenase
MNRVERYELNESANSLNNRTVIIEGIPGAANHDGGRIAFGPDGLLYITAGDAQNEPSAQDKAALSGKILRLEDDGSVPSSNPFGTAVYSYGHRNPQGLAWDDSGQLWATEHGRSGVRSGFDEVNLIEAGKNYGWPEFEGDEVGNGMVSPVLHSGASDTWAPAGAAISEDTLFFTGLRGETLYSAKISGRKLTDFTAHFKGEYGRLRGVAVSPDGEWLYLTTSNRDGRGAVKPNDDKIIKIRLSAFLE